MFHNMNSDEGAMYPTNLFKSYRLSQFESPSANSSSSTRGNHRTENGRQKRTAPQDSQELIRYIDRRDAVERAFLDGAIPKNASERHKIIFKLISNDQFDVLNWMDDRGAITGCWGLTGSNVINDRKFLEKFMRYLQETSNVVSLDLSKNHIGRGQDCTVDTGYWTEGGAMFKLSSLAPNIRWNASRKFC
jgi:hypothetical protein